MMFYVKHPILAGTVRGFRDEPGRQVHSIHSLPVAGESRVEVALTPGAWSSDGKASADTAVRAAQ